MLTPIGEIPHRRRLQLTHLQSDWIINVWVVYHKIEENKNDERGIMPEILAVQSINVSVARPVVA